MEKSLGTAAHLVMCRELVSARKAAGMTQERLAELLAKPQSFVSDYERGQRRLDLVEFLTIAKILNADPYAILRMVDEALRESDG